jgi:hypothetical protein
MDNKNAVKDLPLRDVNSMITSHVRVISDYKKKYEYIIASNAMPPWNNTSTAGRIWVLLFNHSQIR